MPLVSNRNRPTETLETEDGDWYEIITEITGYERDEIQQAGFYIQLPRNQLNKDDPDAMVDGVIRTARHNLLKKEKFIVAWSHYTGAPKRQDLKLMPREHDDIVIDRIDEILGLSRGLQQQDPLPSTSDTSSNGQLKTEKVSD